MLDQLMDEFDIRGNKYDFQCINILKILRELLKIEGEAIIA